MSQVSPANQVVWPHQCWEGRKPLPSSLVGSSCSACYWFGLAHLQANTKGKQGHCVIWQGFWHECAKSCVQWCLAKLLQHSPAALGAWHWAAAPGQGCCPAGTDLMLWASGVYRSLWTLGWGHGWSWSVLSPSHTSAVPTTHCSPTGKASAWREEHARPESQLQGYNTISSLLSPWSCVHPPGALCWLGQAPATLSNWEFESGGVGRAVCSWPWSAPFLCWQWGLCLVSESPQGNFSLLEALGRLQQQRCGCWGDVSPGDLKALRSMKRFAFLDQGAFTLPLCCWLLLQISGSWDHLSPQGKLLVAARSHTMQ